MELVSTIEISGDEREIADAYARGQIDAINSNLAQLEFGEESGSGNLCDEEFILGYFNDKGQEFPSTNDIRTKNYIKVKPNTTYYLAGNDVVVVKLNESKTPIGYILWRKSNVSFTTDDNTHYIGLARPGVTTYSHDIAIIEGASGSYVPYIPSVKMLAEENSQQSIEAMDLKMLGWTVPKECPIQNYVDSDGVFHQRVGRVDLEDALFEYNDAYSLWSSSYIKNIAKYSTTDQISNTNFYSNMYSVYNGSLLYIPTDSFIMGTSGMLWVNNGSSTEKPSGYLYFELAEEKAISVDGNEAVTNVNESLSALGKCKNLLKPTLQTTTHNGVTCTNNGDGTYTLNGTASRLTTFILRDMKLDSSLSYKLTGCPLGGDWDNGYSMYVEKQYWGIDVGKGYEITLTDASNLCGIYIRIIKDTVCNNLVFKPMLTTNLNATYDDFVPYTGDGDTLTADVASIKNDLYAYADGTKAVEKATTADSATKATQDGNGNVIADTYAKKSEIDASYVSTVSGMSYSAQDDEIIIETKVEPNATVADRVSLHDDALNGVFDTMTAVKQNIKETYSTKTDIADMFKPKLVHIKADKELGTIDNTANCVYERICVLSFRFVAKVDIPSGTFMHSSYITYGDTDKVLRPLIKSYLIANKYNADNSLGESMTFSVESITFSDEGVTGGVIRPIQDIPAGTTLYITGTFVIRDENTIT